MNRRYTSAQYRAAVETLRSRMPDCAVTTDVIAGFCGETEEEHRETLAFCENIAFSRMHVFPFSVRAGTKAAFMDGQLPKAVKEARAAELIALGKRLTERFLASRIGAVVEVLCESGGEGYSGDYIRVRVDAPEGAIVRVRYGFGVAVLTKSAKVLRDIDLLKRINEKTKAVVQMTLTTYDEALCGKIEPHVSTTRERFEALLALRDAGIPTVVWLSPILPFINDTEENLRGILDYCVCAEVKGILCFGFGVTLREGDREYFYAALERDFPGMKQRYIRAFGNAYVCNSPNNAKLMRLFTQECKKHGILHRTDDVFRYLWQFETKEKQLSLFDE